MTDNMIGIVLNLLLLVLIKDRHGLFVGAITEPADVEALKQVKAAIDPVSIHPASCLSTWDFSFDPCENMLGAVFVCGIDCATTDNNNIQRVTSLKLDSAGYLGVLSPYIGNLVALQILQVSGNAFGGSIPSSIGHLNKLTIMDLSSNLLSDFVPESVGLLRSLQSLNFANNLLEGTLPGSLKNLGSLTEIRMQNNKFVGTLPDLSTLQMLQFLDLSDNEFSGEIPLAQLPTSVLSLSLKNNRFMGALPKNFLSSLPFLDVLDVSGNQLSGSLDASLFEHPTLQQLNLSRNGFTGFNMPTISNRLVSQMVAIDISNNHISGNLPIHFATMKHLSSLTLSHNSFTGRIPLRYALKTLASLAGLEPLQRLMLDGNYLTGPLPAPFMMLLPGSITASFVDNCLSVCPATMFFCQGGFQKSQSLCRLFNNASV